MPSLSANRALWSEYDWSQAGEEWSKPWGGSASLWWGTLRPRIRECVPAPTILEIAPGYGRWTEYLKDLCQQLVAVDISEPCVEACRRRFADAPHVRVVLTDGRSLDAVADASVDFVFSFDSLVHADAEVIRSYLAELARKLSPTGLGFIHHSNVGAYILPVKRLRSGRAVAWANRAVNPFWRGDDMTAERFVTLCREVGLQCLGQEIVNWGGRWLTDCFSLFGRPRGQTSGRPKVIRNRRFMAEAQQLARLSSHYGGLRSKG